MNKEFILQNDIEEAEPSSKSQISILKSQTLKAQVLSLGFSACGIAQAGPVDEATASHYQRWIASSCHADMDYLTRNVDKRLDPTLLVPGARSIIVVAMNYAPKRRIPASEYQLAVYAYGKDYHDVLKLRLKEIVLQLPSSKIATDTVPILERYWAYQAGIGFLGRNHQLIIPGAGSMFFLGEIITTAEFDHYDSPIINRCGTCHACIDACPTGVLGMKEGEYDTEDGIKPFNSRKCLSYQTIENRGELDADVKEKMGNTIYGCDRCQQVCPWNRFATPTDIPELQPSDRLLSMTRQQWQCLSIDDYRTLFRGSAVKRVKYEGLMRNIRAIQKL